MISPGECYGFVKKDHLHTISSRDAGASLRGFLVVGSGAPSTLAANAFKESGTGAFVPLGGIL